MATYLKEDIAKNYYIGTVEVKEIYMGEEKIWPSVLRTEKGEDISDWSYNDPTRSRTVTPWEYDVYVSGGMSSKRYGTSYNQTETATTTYNYGAWSYNDPTRTRTKTPIYTYTDTTRTGAVQNESQTATITYTYGAWSYNNPTRTRSKTTVYNYSDVTRNGSTTNESQTASTSTQQDGYWNGACGTDYYYVDYPKLRTVYTYSDTVQYGSYYNGAARSQRIQGMCNWNRAWRVTSAWANTGETCDANGTLNGYSCDGTYTVKYYRQKQVESYCFPDMSGSTDTRTTYRAGSQYSRTQVNGQCGYSASASFTVNTSLYDGVLNSVVITLSNGTNLNFTTSGTQTVALPSAVNITRVVATIQNNGSSRNTWYMDVERNGSELSHLQTEIAAGTSGTLTSTTNISVSNGVDITIRLTEQ